MASKWTERIIEAGAEAELMVLNNDSPIYSAVKSVEESHGLTLQEAETIYEFLRRRF